MKLKKYRQCLGLALIATCGAYAQTPSTDNLFEQEDVHSLSERWDLGPTAKGKTFTISPYKPIYVLPGRWSNRPNNQPFSYSEHMDRPAANNYNETEIRFQLSFKTKVVEGLLFGKGDIWLAFTQTANWQAYNEKISRPFRELNYEPEIIFNYPLDLSLHNLKFKMAGLAFNHQSNGKSEPTSRSWNRLVFHLGMEYRDWTIMVKPWMRLKEKNKSDDNARISEYYGKGELTVAYQRNGQVFTFMMRNNMRLNEDYRGFHEFTYTYPIKNNLKAFFVINNGYGESLIDYNWNQTTIGVGISLMEWY
ncbi:MULTISPECIES: phospholipase A [unclassified Myroides]|uniref:phospholipase A n=1 Tax=unclassified Myroides TaxID=2642485 RepID=UPI0015FBB1C9|nr:MULTISPECIES: phospholipase A [unclassified Myroides]MBB1150519.1 phospholipase A [Myroides sp. NP-2]MDM1407489.1 phospholipase A [Myroides sp. DF42-4-2]